MIAILAQLLAAAPLAAAAALPQAVLVEGRKATASATSQLAHKDPRRYAPANAFDGDASTAWVEGVNGLGKGEALTLRFDKPTAIEGVLIVAGYARSGKTISRGARLIESAEMRQVASLSGSTGFARAK